MSGSDGRGGRAGRPGWGGGAGKGDRNLDVFVVAGVEFLKLRRANIFWISIAVAIVFPLLIGFVMAGAADLDVGVVVEQSPAAYLVQYEVVVAIGGLIGFGFLFSWMFGREFTDGTVTNLLSLPTSRAAIVAGKFVVASIWCAGLVLLHFGVGAGFTFVTFPESFSLQLLGAALAKQGITATMVVFLSMPVAFVAGVGRGYLAPLGFVVVAVAAAQLFTALGWGSYFPWAVPGLYSGVAGASFMGVPAAGIASPFVIGFLGAAATLSWWKNADM